MNKILNKLLGGNKQNGSAVGEAILAHMVHEDAARRNHLRDDFDPVPCVPLRRAPSTNRSPY
jgi:hypothetical protein